MKIFSLSWSFYVWDQWQWALTGTVSFWSPMPYSANQIQMVLQFRKKYDKTPFYNHMEITPYFCESYEGYIDMFSCFYAFSIKKKKKKEIFSTKIRGPERHLHKKIAWNEMEIILLHHFTYFQLSAQINSIFYVIIKRGPKLTNKYVCRERKRWPWRKNEVHFV